MSDWHITDVFPEYGPSLDWIGTNGGRGCLQIDSLKAIKVGDVLKTVDGHCSVVRYADHQTLVTRPK